MLAAPIPRVLQDPEYLRYTSGNKIEDPGVI
jgi:hypothetical protein